MNEYVQLLRGHARPMEPIATDAAPRLPAIEGVRAVMFDVYGTMLISGSGDIGTIAAAPAEAFSAACADVGLQLKTSGEEAADLFVATIRAAHEEARGRGIAYPEVDIVAVWRRTLSKLQRRGHLGGDIATADPQRLAIEYECRVNPVWPMPGIERCLQQLSRAGFKLGIISNAQFFTPLLFPALLKRSLGEAGFSADLCFYSYLYGQAKPGLYLFETARDSLASLAIPPGEVLYIGNDMLNDVMPAAGVGFKTALFAGDQRSLRMREADDRTAGVQADLTITDFEQLTGAVHISSK